MSLNRTALRMAAVMALTNGFAEPYPTIAGGRVYDSRIDPLQGVDQEDMVPIVIVFTDTDDGSSMSGNNGGPPFDHAVTLICELSLGGLADEDGGFVALATDPMLEAALDRFEQQVMWALMRDPVNPWSALFRDQLIRVESWKSDRYVEREANVRIAARQITAQVKMKPEDDFGVATSASAPVVSDPLGALLTAIIDDDGPYAPTAQAIADMITGSGGGELGPVVMPTLERVRLIEADQAVTDEDGVPAGARSAGVAQANLKDVPDPPVDPYASPPIPD